MVKGLREITEIIAKLFDLRGRNETLHVVKGAKRLVDLSVSPT